MVLGTQIFIYSLVKPPDSNEIFRNLTKTLTSRIPIKSKQDTDPKVE